MTPTTDDVPPVLLAMQKSDRCACGGRRFVRPSRAMHGYRYRCSRCGAGKVIDESDIDEAVSNRIEELEAEVARCSLVRQGRLPRIDGDSCGPEGRWWEATE